MEKTASRISGAASGTVIRPWSTASPSGLAAYRLLSHAREFGIDRLRETCAIVTAVMVSGDLGTPPTADFLRRASRRQYRIRVGQVRQLIDAEHFNRAIDGWEGLNRERYGHSRPNTG